MGYDYLIGRAAHHHSIAHTLMMNHDVVELANYLMIVIVVVNIS